MQRINRAPPPKLALMRVAVRPAGESGQEQDAHVQPQRPVVDVIEVVFDSAAHLVVGIGLAPQSIDLGPAGDSRLDVVAAGIEGNLLLVFAVVGKRVGRGPTSDMSPLITLMSCGNSSMLQRRNQRPTRVTRQSARVA